MKKKSVQNMKRTGMLEKKQIFGIRKLNVGVASVGIAAALFLSGAGWRRDRSYRFYGS